MEILLENREFFWWAVAGISFILELTVMGMSGPLLFFALAATITGILVDYGVLANATHEILAVGVLSAIIAGALWKPLKAMQNSNVDRNDDSSDMIGLSLSASSEVTMVTGSVRYSGIDWNARLSSESEGETISESSLCTVLSVKGTTLYVKAS